LGAQRKQTCPAARHNSNREVIRVQLTRILLKQSDSWIQKIPSSYQNIR